MVVWWARPVYPQPNAGQQRKFTSLVIEYSHTTQSL